MTIKSYYSALRFLESHIPGYNNRYPQNRGLDRMVKLLSLLDNPHTKFKSVHVAGTSGKGSTASIIAAILQRKFQVGLHTSPHLISICERVKLNGADISEKEFVELLNGMVEAIDEVTRSPLGKPSYFEITTALGFCAFAKWKVDFAVIEVGLGGTWDGTNVITPRVSVITSIGLDHTDILGKTASSITRQKAGIIKKNVPVVTGVTQKNALQIIHGVAHQKNSPVYILGEDFSISDIRLSLPDTRFHFKSSEFESEFSLPLLGAHQARNSAVAIESVKYAISNTVQFSCGEVQSALSNVTISGRMEVISKKPFILLDGAHNPDKMRVLVDAIQAIYKQCEIVSVFAVKEGHDANKMLRQLGRISKKVILTRFQSDTDTGRNQSIKPDELYKIAQKLGIFKALYTQNSSINALMEAIRLVPFNGMILISGSLYLVGEIKAYHGNATA